MQLEELNSLMDQEDINAQELNILLESRENNETTFHLVDVREELEWYQARIKGTDYLIPTTSFQDEIEQISNKKEDYIIVYCHLGQRSAYCQHIMKRMGFKHVINLSHGIAGYNGDILQGQQS